MSLTGERAGVSSIAMRELLRHLTGRVEEEFWSNVYRAAGGACWPWIPRGQCLFVVPGVGTVTAARVAYVIDRGSEPPSHEPYVVRAPSCSDPCCVRPTRAACDRPTCVRAQCGSAT